MAVWYREGTASVDNASTSVTGSATGWNNQAKEGDGITFDGGATWYEIASVEGNTALTLATAFAESTVTDGAYAIDRRSPKWALASDLATRVAALLASITTLILTSGAPDDGIGNDGAIAFDAGAQVFYFKAEGAWGEAVTLQGPQGDPGETGDPGADGDTGWSPVLAIANDSERRVLQVSDWVGGEGTKPATGDYIGASGLTSTIGDAVDVRGPAGADGAGVTGGVLELTELSSDPATPSAGYVKIFAKNDDKRYTINAAGTVEEIGAGGGSGGREVLTGNRTYYVRSDGSDSNDGLADTPGGAFATRQHAWDVIVQSLDLGGYQVTVQCGPSSDPTGSTLMDQSPIGGRVVFTGDTTTPSNCTISSTADCFKLTASAQVKIEGFSLASSANGVYAVGAGASVEIGNNSYGACTGFHLRADDQAYIAAYTSYSISGSAGRHAHATRLAVVNATGPFTVTLSGTPAFSAGFVFATQCAVVGYNSVTFSGSATGARYSATLNAVINSFGGGASYFPGNSAGSTTTGAQYA